MMISMRSPCRGLSAFLFAAVCCTGAHAQQAGGVTVPVGTPTVVIYPAQSIRSFQRVVNAGTTNQGTAWCMRGTPNVLPTVNGAGSFPLAPFGNALGLPSIEEFAAQTAPVPQGGLVCVSDGGSSSAPAILTVEVR